MKYILLAALLLLAPPTYAQTDNETVSQWAQQAIPTILNIVPQDFKAQKESNRALFTKEGHDSFYKAMKQARIRESLEANDQTAKVRKMCVTNIEPSPKIDTFWTVTSEILYDFSDGTKTRTEKQKVIALIEDIGKDGGSKFVIAQYIALPASEYEFECNDGAPDPRAARRKEIRKQIRTLEDELRALSGNPQTDVLR